MRRVTLKPLPVGEGLGWGLFPTSAEHPHPTLPLQGEGYPLRCDSATI